MNYSKQLARQARESPSVVFFDNNFFRPLINGNFHGQLAKLKSDLNTVLKLPCVPWRTASSVMEWIGLNSENLPKPPSFDTKFVEDGNFFACAQRHYQKHYATVPELDSDNLERLSAERRWRVSKEMLGFWDDTMFGILADAALSGWLSPLSSKKQIPRSQKANSYQHSYQPAAAVMFLRVLFLRGPVRRQIPSPPA